MLLALLCGLPLLLQLLVSAQTSCMNNYGLRYTTSQQMITLNAYGYTHSTYMQCAGGGGGGGGGTRTALYARFSSPSSGNYYVRARSATEDLVMEIRSGAMCEGTYLDCNNDLNGTTTMTGFNSIALEYGQDYMIFVAHRTLSTLSYAVQLEIGLVGTPPATTCTDYPMASTTSLQRKNFYDDYQYTTPLRCAYGGVITAHYTSFVPPISGYYSVIAPYDGSELVVEIRAGSCTGISVGCGGYVSESTSPDYESHAGLRSVYLSANTTYVILAAGKSGYSLIYRVYFVNVGLVVGGGGGSGSNGAGTDGFDSTLFITILLPCMIMGLALILALIFCCKDGPAKSNQKDAFVFSICGFSSLARIRKLAIATWFLSIVICATIWTVVWSSAAYLLALITLVLSARIHHAANAPNFAQTHVAKSAGKYTMALTACGMFLFAHVIPTVMQVTIRVRENGTQCDALHLSAYTSCMDQRAIYPVYGIVAAVSMFVLAPIATSLGQAVLQVASQLRNISAAAGEGTSKNVVVADTVADDGGEVPVAISLSSPMEASMLNHPAMITLLRQHHHHHHGFSSHSDGFSSSAFSSSGFSSSGFSSSDSSSGFSSSNNDSSSGCSSSDNRGSD